MKASVQLLVQLDYALPSYTTIFLRLESFLVLAVENRLLVVIILAVCECIILHQKRQSVNILGSITYGLTFITKRS